MSSKSSVVNSSDKPGEGSGDIPLIELACKLGALSGWPCSDSGAESSPAVLSPRGTAGGVNRLPGGRGEAAACILPQRDGDGAEAFPIYLESFRAEEEAWTVGYVQAMSCF